MTSTPKRERGYSGPPGIWSGRRSVVAWSCTSGSISLQQKETTPSLTSSRKETAPGLKCPSFGRRPTKSRRSTFIRRHMRRHGHDGNHRTRVRPLRRDGHRRMARFRSRTAGPRSGRRFRAGTAFLRADGWHHRIVLEQHGTDDLLGAGLRVAGPEEFRALQKVLRAADLPFDIAASDGRGNGAFLR